MTSRASGKHDEQENMDVLEDGPTVSNGDGCEGDATGKQASAAAKLQESRAEMTRKARTAPIDHHSMFRRIFLGWMTPIVRLAGTKPLTGEDLWPTGEPDLPFNAYSVIRRNHEAALAAPDSSRFLSRHDIRRTIMSTFFWLYLRSTPMQVIYGLGGIISTMVVLKQLLLFFPDPTQPLGVGVGLAFSMLICQLFMNIAYHQGFMACKRLGIRLRSCVCYMVFDKLLRSAPGSSNMGEMINIVSNDAQKMSDSINFAHWTWYSPLMLSIILGCLLYEVGPACIPGFALLLSLTPATIVLSRHIARWRGRYIRVADERVRAATEIFSAVQTIKFWAWEESYAARVADIRDRELTSLRMASFVNSASKMLSHTVPVVATFITFSVFTALGGELDGATTFTTLGLFNMTRMPIMMFATASKPVAEGWVGLNRLKKFMSTPDLIPIPKDSSGDMGVTLTSASFKWRSTLEDPAARAEDERRPPDLVDVSLEARRGELVAVVGVVGSGKSTLLGGILGQSPCVSGTLRIRGTVGYVAQQPWIQNATLRENICFARAFDAARYESVIAACSLAKDLAMLPAGDATEIGERGINLSGGQKQRVAVARALYQDSDIYLLDDPLSAVDSHVGRHIFENCIAGAMKDKCVIMVTNQLHYLQRCSKIIVFKDGRISEQGTFSELCSAGVDFADLIAKHIAVEKDASSESEDAMSDISSICGDLRRTATATGPLPDAPQIDVASHDAPDPIPEFIGKRASGRFRAPSPEMTAFGTSLGAFGTGRRRANSAVTARDSPSAAKRWSMGFLEDNAVALRGATGDKMAIPSWTGERKGAPRGVEDGAVDGAGNRFSTAALETNAAALRAASDAPPIPTITEPAGSTDAHKKTDAGAEKKERAKDGTLVVSEERASGQVGWRTYRHYVRAAGWGPFFIVVLLFMATQTVRVLADWWLTQWMHHKGWSAYYVGVYGGLSAALVVLLLTTNLFFVVVALRAASVLHNATFSRVLRAPMAFFDTNPLGRIINRFSQDQAWVDDNLPMTVYEVLYWGGYCGAAVILIVALLPWFIVPLLGLLGLFYYYQTMYRKAARELKRVEGLARSPLYAHFAATIQGLPTIQAFELEQEFQAKNEVLLDAHQRAVTVAQMLERWVALRLDLLTTGATFFSALAGVLLRGTLADGLAGLAVTSAILLASVFQWFGRQLAEGEAWMTSVERLQYYADHVPQEAAPDGDFGKWPTRGAIEFRDVVLSYREGLDPVLRGVTLSIKGGERVGIVGRTGAGKSSLIVSLYRLAELTSGAILIDGVDIASVGLDHLRSHLSITPQSPVLFQGSIRSNLDPFGRYSDDALWRCLERVNLRTVVSGLPGGLEAPVAEAGENLSAGQRQLVCLARALLPNNRILILDEATAAVDLETDEFIQAALRAAMGTCTMLIIAHRLNTVMDCDRVLVMSDGRVGEFGRPVDLLADPQSLLSALVDETGPASAARLRRIAQGE